MQKKPIQTPSNFRLSNNTNNFEMFRKNFFFAIFCLQKLRDHTSVDRYPFFPAWIIPIEFFFYLKFFFQHKLQHLEVLWNMASGFEFRASDKSGWLTTTELFPVTTPATSTSEAATAVAAEWLRMSQNAAVTCELNFFLSKALSLRLNRDPQEWARCKWGWDFVLVEFVVEFDDGTWLKPTWQLLTEVVSEDAKLFSLSSITIVLVVKGGCW